MPKQQTISQDAQEAFTIFLRMSEFVYRLGGCRVFSVRNDDLKLQAFVVVGSDIEPFDHLASLLCSDDVRLAVPE